MVSQAVLGLLGALACAGAQRAEGVPQGRTDVDRQSITGVVEVKYCMS